MPEPTDHPETNVVEACALLAEASAGELVLAGFGRDPWPLDVAYDMSALVEQLPALLAGLAAGQDVDVALYPQGVECTLGFRPRGDDVEISCTSRTSWRPEPAVETVDRRDLVAVLERFASDVTASLALVAPALAAAEPFASWPPRRGRGPG